MPAIIQLIMYNTLGRQPLCYHFSVQMLWMLCVGRGLNFICKFCLIINAHVEVRVLISSEV